MNSSIFLILITMVLVALIDYIPRAFLLAKKAARPVTTGRVPDFLIMPTVYGDISYLQNISFLKRYAKRVVICTSVHESPEFYHALDEVCEQYGFRSIRATVPIVKGQPVKNAYTIYKGAFWDLKKLGARGDTPCILMDADTYAQANVNDLVRAFKTNDFDIASMRCEAAKEETLLEKLQAFEYRLAMDNRRMDPWLTSGAANMAKASVFRHVFAYHSDFFAGGDIEIGKLAGIMGYRIGHIDFTFYTAVPDTFKAWFKQRIIWFAGGVRHHVANMGIFGWHHFFILFYNSLLVYMLFPLRWIELVNFPFTMVALIVLSWIYTAILCIGRGWQPAYLVLPVYSFIQSMIILPIAVGRYAKLAWQQRSFGLLRYDTTRVSLLNRWLYRALNTSSALFVVYAAISFTSMRIQYWMQNGYVFHLLAR